MVVVPVQYHVLSHDSSCFQVNITIITNRIVAVSVQYNVLLHDSSCFPVNITFTNRIVVVSVHYHVLSYDTSYIRSQGKISFPNFT